jgi:hypothetical protein
MAARAVQHAVIPWTAIAGVVSAAVSFVYSYAVLGQRVETAEKEIISLRISSGAQGDALGKIGATLERIDERLKYVVPERMQGYLPTKTRQ